MKCLSVISIGAACAFGSATLVNGNFENPSVTTGTFTSNGIPGWFTSSSAGVWNIPSSSFFQAEAPEGTQIGYSNGASLAQTASNNLGLGVTTLTAMGGRRSDSFAGSFRMELWAGSTVSSTGVVSGGTLLGSTVFNHTAISPGTFQQVSVNYTASVGDALLGQSLTVAFIKTTGSQMDMDDVQLTGAVPEPTSLIALGLAVALLKTRKRTQ